MDLIDRTRLIQCFLKDQMRNLRSSGECSLSNSLARLDGLEELYLSESSPSSSSQADISTLLTAAIEQSIELLTDTQRLYLQSIGLVSQPLHECLFLKFSPALLDYDSGEWSSPPSRIFNVRGKDYDDDSLKVLSEEPLFFLRGIQMIRSNDESNGSKKGGPLQTNIAHKSWSGYPKYSHDNEWLIVNYMIPGSTNIQIICYFTASREANEVIRDIDSNLGSPGWRGLLARFWKADAEFCNKRFKLIPSVVEGPWPVRMAVGKKPALTGQKVQQLYSRGPGYFEIDINIASSSVAANILKLVRIVHVLEVLYRRGSDFYRCVELARL